MTSPSEAARLNLEYYRKQAKALLKSWRAGDPVAAERVAAQSKLRDTSRSLNTTQLTVAREQGFPSWPRFRAYLQQSQLDVEGGVRAFVNAAVADLADAEKTLAAHPSLIDANFHTALVLGNANRVEQEVRGRPSCVKAKGGPLDSEPLVYVCFSRFAGAKSNRRADILQTARALLANGADPNAFYIDERWPDNPLPCLYGATGLNNYPELARVLLEAGAQPNDSESVYHSTEHPDLVCLELLFEHGAHLKGTNALKHMLDREDMRGVKLLLDAGADPNERNGQGETALHWAAFRGRSAEIVAVLLDRGVDLDAKREDGRTAYAMALRGGHVQIAELLKQRGANTDVSAVDRFQGECMRLDPEVWNRSAAELPDFVKSAENAWLLPDLAMFHRSAAVRALLAAGVPVNSRGDHGATALHWSCWKGDADLVKILLQHGASLTIKDQQFQGTPPGWFTHGLANCWEDRGDYPEVARLLLDAGATLPEADLPTKDAGVNAVLRERGLIE